MSVAKGKRRIKRVAKDNQIYKEQCILSDQGMAGRAYKYQSD